MAKKIAVFGGGFNPPGIHHRQIVLELSRRFDEVIVIPSGPRPDKATVNDVEPLHRAVMADMTFQDLPKVKVELFDLEQATFTRTHKLEEMFRKRGEVWHVIGSDLIERGKDGKSIIEREWAYGEKIWNSLNFVVIARSGYKFTVQDLPPHRQLLLPSRSGSSSQIRERVFKHRSFDSMVIPRAANYIKRCGLYRGTVPLKTASFVLEKPQILFEIDEKNRRAKEMAQRLKRFASRGSPNLVVTIGGDGTMLHAIRKHWRLRLPFFGVNTGHRGFLLNDRLEFPLGELVLRQLPLLYVETVSPSGKKKHSLAFNDAWLERKSGQSAWVEVRINSRVVLPRLVSDGVLVSTAAGSTAYARAMGATPLLADAPALLLVGSNVMEPANWKSAHLSLDSRLDFRNLDSKKRPTIAYVDGVPQGEAAQMKVRVSRIAAVELAFSPDYDIAEKIVQIQFPQQGF